MFELLGLIFGNIFSGGATGLIGVIAQRFFDFKNKKLDIEIEREKRETVLAVARLNMEAADKEWAARHKIEETKGDSAAFTKSIWEETPRYSNPTTLTPKQQWVMVVLDALRGVVRPLLTIYLCALTTYVWFQVRSLMGGEDLDLLAALEVWKMVVGNILYLTTTVVLWWFGTRNKVAQPGSKG